MITELASTYGERCYGHSGARRAQSTGEAMEDGVGRFGKEPTRHHHRERHAAHGGANIASHMGRLLAWCPYVKRRLEEMGEGRLLLAQGAEDEGPAAEGRKTGSSAGLRLRTILLAAGIALCLVGGFLHDPHPLWGFLDISAGIILVFGVAVTMVAIAMVPWRRIDLEPSKAMLVGSLLVILLAAYVFDPRQGYRGALNIFMDGNLWSLGILMFGIGLLAVKLSLGNRARMRWIVLAALVLCLFSGIVLTTRIPKHTAIEKGLDYFSHLENPALVGA